MPEKIFPKKIKGTTYYYYQYTYREKVDPQDTTKGKGPGSGKSRVKTYSEYLGTAKAIRNKLKESKSRTISVKHLSFGVLAAGYQIAKEIGLIVILKKHITGHRFGLPRWLFFFIAILNRMDHATSKEKMGQWASGTILPHLLLFDPDMLNSKTFWYATDDIISEGDLKRRRLEQSNLANEVFVGLDDSIFRAIEKDVFTHIRKHFAIEPHTILYDSTNFFTYIQPQTPCKLAENGHNKDYHHHLKQVGLAVSVESANGIPFFHRTYRGNSTDSTTFARVVDGLIQDIKLHMSGCHRTVLILDKGNNSKDNFNKLKGKLDWVGSLVPSHYPDLLDKPLNTYKGEWKGLKFFRVKRKVAGIDCILVMTYNASLYNKQQQTRRIGIEKLQQKIREKVMSYKRQPRNHVPKGVETMRKDSHYGSFIRVEIKDGLLIFHENIDKLTEAKKRSGKNLIFSSRLKAESSWIIDQYKQKDVLEQDFHFLKDPELIHNRPIRHWTDTKVSAFCFCCIMALLLVRIIQLMAKKSDLVMSPAVLKQELKDLQLITWIDDSLHIESKVSGRSTIQQKLWELFNLQEIEEKLTIHKQFHKSLRNIKL